MTRRLLSYLVPFYALTLVAFGTTPAMSEDVPQLSDEEMKKASQIYFDRCAGCHGTLRKGATGPAIGVDKTRAIPIPALSTIISEGTVGGMPPWKTVLSADDITLIAKFLQNNPPQPPEWGMEAMKETWKLIIPPDKRPTAPPKGKNLDNYFGIVSRDLGKVHIIDGDTKQEVVTINTGFATHILRTSASGRYFYSIGRDGKASMIDLWSEPPTLVAEIKTGLDARSIDSSKYKGPKGNFLDKYVVVGNYWPPHYVIMRGDTLEPIKIVSTRGYTYDANEYHPEPRVASIVSSHHAPEWVLNIKEAGVVLLVDYSMVENGTVIETKINAERFLHDGGWDATKRYFLVAANMKNKVAVIDTIDRKLVAMVETGNKPHPGRGANFVDPKFGPVWATPHIGEPTLALIGADPKGHKENAWKVVRKLPVSGNGLFVKAHPKSKNVWVDNTLSTDEAKARTLDIYSINDLDGKPKSIVLGESGKGKVVHMEYNKNGDEMWVSFWGKEGKIVIYDDKTLQVKKEIPLHTPTGKFNVYNTMKDIY